MENVVGSVDLSYSPQVLELRGPFSTKQKKQHSLHIVWWFLKYKKKVHNASTEKKMDKSYDST